jgi:hypothetical protein
MDGEHFEELGIYKIFSMPEGAQNESAARGTNVHQSSRRRRQMVDSSIELTHQEFVDMVSANDVQAANDRASRKVTIADDKKIPCSHGCFNYRNVWQVSDICSLNWCSAHPAQVSLLDIWIYFFLIPAMTVQIPLTYHLDYHAFS